LEISVVKKKVSAWLEWGVIKQISFSMAGKEGGQKRKFQHGWKGSWSKSQF
jgi:hypothetical protein